MNPLIIFWLTVDGLHDLKQLKLTVEVFTREMFNDFLNLCIFSLFVISIINRLILHDGDFVCCRVISEYNMPWKWGCLSINGDTSMRTHGNYESNALECCNKISHLLHPYFYNINTFNASFKSQFNFTHNFDDLQLFWMCSSIP